MAIMQIFVSDPNPKVCAENLDDLRLNKMILESSQLLSAASHIHGVYSGVLPCGPGWKNHPLAKWTAMSRGNFNWLLSHLSALLDEFEYRREKQHAYSWHPMFYYDYVLLVPKGDQMPFINCTAPDFKTEEYTKDKNIYQIYRNYLAWKWSNDKRKPKWTKRTSPSWFSFALQ